MATLYNEVLLSWSDIQYDILSGGNSSNDTQTINKEDLPHFYKRQKASQQVFSEWIKNEKRSDLITGAWSRAFFIGGWNESGNWDTYAYNLQTPSLFFDLRIPIARPDFSSSSGFESLSLDELRVMSRQQCTGGYSLINGNPPIITRHFTVDWDYHPSFSHQQPNRWRIEVHPKGTSFKEISVVNDPFGQASCLQRWEKLDNSDGPFFAARKVPSSSNSREGIFCVTGNHFGFALDRNEPLPDFSSSESKTCSELVDEAWILGDRKKIYQMLDLIGSYGFVTQGNSTPWTITKSTHPWLENTSLFKSGEIKLNLDEKNLPLSITWNSDTWEIMECSFTLAELHKLLLLDLKAKL